MEQYELKKLDLDALHLVYHDHLTPDFPPAERKPLAAMEKLLSAGRYEPWGLYRGEELMAYAMMWKDPEGGFELLDYLGVCQGKPRGQGIGTDLVKIFIGVMEEKNYPNMFIMTSQFNTGAKRLYQSLGFQPKCLLHDVIRKGVSEWLFMRPNRKLA